MLRRSSLLNETTGLWLEKHKNTQNTQTKRAKLRGGHRRRHLGAAGQALPAERALLHLQVDHKLSDRQKSLIPGPSVSVPLKALLFYLNTNSCTSSHQSIKLLKFAYDAPLI
ncbi:hypothetical protein ATANTOWER_031961 [Ataeniobius toweri]|uniref:Uncharacterized protein n=1 Tax=Ataeniobius toweri TaxID=208326 RepID=A0ABU7B3Q5_9TELE|nr:hypothetical protein [Ataeniobius toweri]